MLFIDAISHQHLCVPRCDCMGLVCSLTIDTGGQLRQLKVGFYLNLDTEEFEFLYAGDLYKLKIDGRFLAHLSRRLTGELIVYPCSGVRPSSVRPSVHPSSTISKIFSSETALPIKAKLHVEHP